MYFVFLFECVTGQLLLCSDDLFLLAELIKFIQYMYPTCSGG